uniref:Uncharacterized protein n=1 Tax=Anguilla anguilla TaxID=7936 RepID=A0A0E9V3U5_ANGAN
MAGRGLEQDAYDSRPGTGHCCRGCGRESCCPY